MHHTIEIKNDRAYVTIIGDGDSQIATQFVQDAEQALNDHPNTSFDVIVDMTQSGMSDYAGIKVYKNFLKEAPLKKIAFVIDDELITSLVKVAVPQREEETRYFKTLEEAEEWLGE